MAMASIRSRIIKIWSTKYGLTLTPGSLSWLEKMIEHYELGDTSDDDVVEAFNKAMEDMAKCYTGALEDYAQIVDVDALEDVYARLQAVEGNVDALIGGNGLAHDDNHKGRDHATSDLLDRSTYIKVIDAFSMPWIHFDGEKKSFVHHNNMTTSTGTGQSARKHPSLAGAADSKAQYLRDRYNILKQVILRNEHFSPPALPGHDRENYMKLTGIKNLLGRQGGHFLLFGMLTRSEDGTFVLEDLDDQVKLDISEASPASGMFTEGCFALLDGQYTKDSIFKVMEIGHPPSETREATRSIFGHVDFLGTGALTLTEEAKLHASEKAHPESFLFFSDMHLDSPKHLLNFRKVLQAYEGYEAGLPPALCVLCGNFSSKSVNLTDGKSLRQYQANFSAFADLLLAYPKCAREMHFVFVPGPADPYDVSNLILPRRPLPPSLTKAVREKLPKVTFASNPCRITYKSQEIVVFRDDLMSRMLRNTVRLKNDLSTLANRELLDMMQSAAGEQTVGMSAQTENWTDEQKGEARLKVLSQFLVQTVLDQSHLAPLSLQVRPVLWEFDQALRLFPMPTALVLADKYQPYDVTYENCHVFNPGSFAGSDFTWSMYDTSARTSDQSGFGT